MTLHQARTQLRALLVAHLCEQVHGHQLEYIAAHPYPNVKQTLHLREFGSAWRRAEVRVPVFPVAKIFHAPAPPDPPESEYLTEEGPSSSQLAKTLEELRRYNYP